MSREDVRSRRQADPLRPAWQEGSRTLRTVIDTIPVGVVVTDVEGTITLSNPVARSILGYTEGETAYGWREGYGLYSPAGAPFPPEDLPLRRAIERGETTTDLEMVVRREDGRELTILAGGAPLRDKEGRVVGAVMVFRGITAREQAERALAESEARYRRIVETAQEGIALLDAEGAITYTNERMAEQLRCAPDEMLGTPLLGFVDEESRDAVQGLFEKLHRGERDLRDIKFRCPARAELWTLVASTPFFEHGTYAGALLMVSDLTAHREAEAARARLAAIVESSEDAILGRDLEGTVTAWSPGAERLFGYTAEEAVGQPLSIIVPPDRQPEVQDILDRVGRGERLANYETVRVRKDGTPVEVSLSLSPIRIGAGEIVGTSAIIRDIGERKRAEREQERLLAEAQRRAAELDAVITAVADGLILYGPQAQVLRMNAAAEKTLGLSAAEYARMPVSQRAEVLRMETPDGRRLTMEEGPVGRGLRGEVVVGQVVVLHLRDGRTVWESASVAPVRAPDGALIGAVGTFTDITAQHELLAERERLLGEVQQQREFLGRVVEGAPVGIVVLRGPEYRYALVNPAFQQLARGKGEILGRTVAEVFPEVAEQLVPLLDRVYRTGEPYYAVDAPYVLERGRGPEEAFFTFSYSRLYDAQGRVEGILVLALETTDQVLARRRVEELARQLAAEQSRLRAIIDNAPVAIVVSDERARVLLTNPLADRLYARPVPYGEEFESHAMMQLQHPDGTPYEPRDLPLTRSALDGETVTGLQMAIVWPGGERRDLLVNSAPIRDESGRITGAVGVFQDITERQQVEAERDRLLAEVQALYEAERRARTQAEEAVRARDQFLAAAAHELKTPVANLTGFAELALRRLAAPGALEPGQVRRALERIDHESWRLSRLVSQLLDISDIEAGELVLERRESDVAQLVRNVTSRVQAGTRRHSLLVRAPGSLAAVVDPLRVEQVLYNLLDNAIKFSPEGTSVEIDLTAPDAETLQFSVRDHGPGIPPERRGRLFSRFYQAQTGRPFAGLGLGLYFASQIVALHGGHIEATFPADGGTRFVVTLPRGLHSGVAPARST